MTIILIFNTYTLFDFICSCKVPTNTLAALVQQREYCVHTVWGKKL